MANVLGEGLAPKDAIAYWKDKVLMTDDEAKKLTGGAKSRAFYVSGLAQHDQVALVHKALLSALENGETLQSFKKNIANVIKDNGWNSHRVTNIFRTNMQTAYAAGSWAQIQKTKTTRPYLQYVCIVDRRTRPQHAVLNGLVFPIDHEFWSSNYPPNGYRCRCGHRTLSERQVAKDKMHIETDMPSGLMYTDPKTGMEYFVNLPGADKGFSQNVGKDWLAGLDTPIVERLERYPTPIAQNFVRNIVAKDFDRWEKAPNFDLPIAVLAPKQAEEIGAKSVVALLSVETMAKQKKNHPELTKEDYRKAQDAVAHGEMYKQDGNNMAFVLREAGGVICIVKATKEGNKLYVTSLRRLSREEAKQEKAIQQVKKR